MSTPPTAGPHDGDRRKSLGKYVKRMSSVFKREKSSKSVPHVSSAASTSVSEVEQQQQQQQQEEQQQQEQQQQPAVEAPREEAFTEEFTTQAPAKAEEIRVEDPTDESVAA